MKITIITTKSAAILAGTATMVAGMILTTPARAAGNGTDILHFSLIKTTMNNGVETGADGVVVASQEKQGKADNQKLNIAVTGLTNNATYELVAAIDSDTNLTDITEFTTDDKGKALLEYRSQDNGHRGGKGTSALPASLNPVSLIREVDIVNSSTQTVLTADLTMPDKLNYLIKRNLSTNAIKAELRIEATTSHTRFDLMSSGLAPGGSYLLVFNGNVVQTNTSSANGRLDIKTSSQTPPYVLDLRTVELWDSSSNVVLQTALP